MAVAIDVKELTVAYDGLRVLDDVSFAVDAGTLVGIVGPNGAGKSTLIKALLGLVPSESGRVSFFGRGLHDVRQNIAYVPQRTAIDWDFPITVLETVLIGTYPQLGWLRRPGKKELAKAYECLEKVGMERYAKRQISRLSGGQQQRMFIARALAQDPVLLFLDEPFVGVDTASEQTILAILKELRDEGKTALIVHHDLPKVREHFDEALLLNKALYGHGPATEMVTRDRIAELFAMPILQSADATA